MAEIRFVSDFAPWLKGRTQSECAIFAVRAAIRTLPILWRAIEYEHRPSSVASRLALSFFRAAAVSWLASQLPTSDEEKAKFGIASSVAFSGATEASFGFPAVGHLLDVLDAITAAGRTASSLGNEQAASAAFDAIDAASRAAGSSTATSAAFAPAALAASIADAAAIEGGTTPSELADSPLWPSEEVPDGPREGWHNLRSYLIAEGDHWRVWADWYEGLLAGRPPQVNTVELARIMLDDSFWWRGPATVNREMLRLVEEAKAKLPPLPAQSPGPHYHVGDDDRIAAGPADESDPQGNDLGRINQLRPVILDLARRLEDQLSRNEFPELIYALSSYRNALGDGDSSSVAWGSVWAQGVILENHADAARRKIQSRMLPELEDPVKAALNSMLTLHGPMVLASREGRELSDEAARFAMTRDQVENLRKAAAEIAERLKNAPDVIALEPAKQVEESAAAVGAGPHPERGAVAGMVTVKNVVIVLLSGALVASPAALGAMGGPVIDAFSKVGTAGLVLLAYESLKRNPTFVSLTTVLGNHFQKAFDADPKAWLDEKARRLAPFGQFVIDNEQPLRTIAEAAPQLKWMLRYIDFIVRKN